MYFGGYGMLEKAMMERDRIARTERMNEEGGSEQFSEYDFKEVDDKVAFKIIYSVMAFYFVCIIGFVSFKEFNDSDQKIKNIAQNEQMVKTARR